MVETSVIWFALLQFLSVDRQLSCIKEHLPQLQRIGGLYAGHEQRFSCWVRRSPLLGGDSSKIVGDVLAYLRKFVSADMGLGS